MTERFRVVPAVYVLLRRHGDAGSEVLLQLRQNTGYMDGKWAMAAAGHVEAAESVFEAGCREAAEELGVRIEPRHLRALCVMHRTGGTGLPIDERVDFFFECWQWSSTPRLVESDKTADLRWFPLDDLPEPVVPHERLVLGHVHADTLPPVVTFGFDATPSRPSSR
ncbi:NUDIX hydrolase [Phytoactinopolyspora limicola]|uniref:NUDIX hydrolase n=1 Tax=Phytoactinopolyspora limicola TaxID=2715536 RepID=UPI00140C04E1|nr:NUDIX domain-containing protein [Phytoactinopolyspora limicola]